MLKIEEEIKKVLPSVIKWRRQIHQFPELGFKEFKTASLITDVLDNSGLKIVRYDDSTGVIVELDGDKPGPTVGFRADMDALEVAEQVDVPFKSKHKGIMHACGHDFHVAILMGVAKILSSHKDKIEGKIIFVFQPAEEAPPGGAQDLVKRGLFKDFNIDSMMALHVARDLKVGHIQITPGYSSANTDGAVIEIHGESCHGATPNKGVDAVMIGAQLVIALQSIVSRNVDPLDSAVISVGILEGGELINSIADKATLKITIRSLSEETRELLKDKIHQITQGICQTFGAKATIDYQIGYPAVYNDEKVLQHIKDTAAEVLGEENIHEISQSNMGGDDYAYFLQEVPGAIFLLGGAFPDKKNYPHHSPHFQINEDCIIHGLRLVTNLLMNNSNKESRI